MTSLPIKRFKFSQDIRKNAIQLVKKELRLNLLKEQQDLDIKIFQNLYNQCRSQKFTQQSCRVFLEYIFLTRINRAQLIKQFKILKQYLKRFGRQNPETVKKCANIFTRIIYLFLQQKKPEKKQNQDIIVQNFYQQIIDCMLAGQYSSEFFAIWEQLFLFSHKEICQRFFHIFKQVIQNGYISIGSSQINVMITVLVNFVSHQFCDKLSIQIIDDCFKNLQIIYQHYQLGSKQTLQALQFIKQLIFSKQELISKTRIVRLINLKLFFQLKNYLKNSQQQPEILQKCLQIFIKIFTLTDSSILETILYQNQDLFLIIRKLLPVQIQSFKKIISSQQMQEEVLQFDQSIVNHVIILLSNIAAISSRITQILIQGDMLRTLKILFNDSSLSMKINMSYIFYNLCVLGNQQSIQLMIQHDLLDCILFLINQSFYPDAVKNALNIFIKILSYQNANKFQIRKNFSIKNKNISSVRLQINKIKQQFQNSLNSILFTDSSFCKQAQQCLLLLDSFQKQNKLSY